MTRDTGLHKQLWKTLNGGSRKPRLGISWVALSAFGFLLQNHLKTPENHYRAIGRSTSIPPSERYGTSSSRRTILRLSEEWFCSG